MKAVFYLEIFNSILLSRMRYYQWNAIPSKIFEMKQVTKLTMECDRLINC